MTRKTNMDSAYSWYRLGLCLVYSVTGGVGMWSVVALFPQIEFRFGLSREETSVVYTATLFGFAMGSLLAGRVADWIGAAVPLATGAVMLSLGYLLLAFTKSYLTLVLAHFIFLGALGSATTFSLLISDASLWFQRRRGVAVALAASGNYMSGVLWVPAIQFAYPHLGWRGTFLALAIICLPIMLACVAMLGTRDPPVSYKETGGTKAALRSTGVSPRVLLYLLTFAGVACCVAMAMPQVHILTYCIALGYGPAVGTQMLALMLGAGVISRIMFGFVGDALGGVRTILLASSLQCVALFFFLPFDGIISLYLVSALFGISQGGIVPSYALIVRQYFPSSQANWNISVVTSATVLGMGIGGWMAGAIYDVTESYLFAFINGIVWNLFNIAVLIWLLLKERPQCLLRTRPIVPTRDKG